jgi:transcriptional regulator GlxA family with amidase domain
MASSDIISSFYAMTKILRIGLLLFPRCMPAGLFAFSDLLNAANRQVGRALFETRFVALQTGLVECAQGVSLHVSETLEHADLDAILVPGFWAESASQVDAMIDESGALISSLARRANTLMLWSYCSGVSLLAASGGLNGQSATVTWWLAETMARRYKKVKWQTEQNCIVNERTATASGVNGHQPIAQALVERYVSTDALHHLIKLMVLPRPVQTHDIFQAASMIEQSSVLLRKLHGLVEQLPAQEITVQRLAERLGMAQRTLARQVMGQTGVSIATYARRIKLNQASERLILTSSSVSAICAELGFSSDSNMRRMFKELTALTPLEYRQRFGRL